MLRVDSRNSRVRAFELFSRIPGGPTENLTTKYSKNTKRETEGFLWHVCPAPIAADGDGLGEVEDEAAFAVDGWGDEAVRGAEVDAVVPAERAGKHLEAPAVQLDREGGGVIRRSRPERDPLGRPIEQ